MPSNILMQRNNNNLYTDVYRECADMIKGFVDYIYAEPIELVEDCLLKVNRWLRVNSSGVRVELDRYRPAFRHGALRVIDGVIISGMPMIWTPTTIYLNDGDFIGRFSQDEVERLDLARDLVSYILHFVASHVEK